MIFIGFFISLYAIFQMIDFITITTALLSVLIAELLNEKYGGK